MNALPSQRWQEPADDRALKNAIEAEIEAITSDNDRLFDAVFTASDDPHVALAELRLTLAYASPLLRKLAQGATVEQSGFPDAFRDLIRTAERCSDVVSKCVADAAASSLGVDA